MVYMNVGMCRVSIYIHTHGTGIATNNNVEWHTCTIRFDRWQLAFDHNNSNQYKCATLGVGMKVAVCYVWVDAKDENVMVCATTLRRNF